MRFALIRICQCAALSVICFANASSPKGRDRLICAYNFSQTKISRRKILREIVFYTSLFYLKYLTPFSKIGWYFSPKMF